MESAERMNSAAGGGLPAQPYPEKRSAEENGRMDRRKHIRYRVKDLVLVKLRSGADGEIGQLLDISAGGLSFCYFADAARPAVYSEICIAPNDGIFHIEKIPLSTTSDIELDYQALFSIRTLRRQGIKFLDLRPEQKTRLDAFLSACTPGEPAANGFD